MSVGEDVALLIHHEARSQEAGLAVPPPFGPEEPFEEFLEGVPAELTPGMASVV